MAVLPHLTALLRPQALHARATHSALLRAPARGLATAKSPTSLFASLDTFPDRHIGPDDHETARMLKRLGYDSMDAFVADTVPEKIRIAASSVSDESIPSLSESKLFRRAKMASNTECAASNVS